MSDIPPQNLDYAVEPARRHILSVKGVVTALAAGALVLASAPLGGLCLMWVVAALAGVIIGNVSARSVSGNAFVAGIVPNAIAAAATLGCATVLGVFSSGTLPASIDWVGMIGATSLAGGCFIIPGLLGSLWVWEGRM
jgi:hypothetical protein